MIEDSKEIEKLMQEVDQVLKKDLQLYLIGGGMLLYHGLKPATKDIDLVVEKKDAWLAADYGFKTIGFTTRFPTPEYQRMHLSQILLRDDFRIDLFHKKVCGGFSLSDSMIKRAKKVLQLKHLGLYLCSLEDVFLFKTFTEREGDLEDCIALARRGIAWDAILKELQYQIKTAGREVWITWVGERLDVLEERGLVIPILPEVNKLRNAYLKDFDRKMQQGK